MTSEDSTFKFGSFTLDPMQRTLTKGGKRRSLTEMPFDLLVFLVRNRHRAVGNDELCSGSWIPGGGLIEIDAVNQHFSKIFRALGEDRRVRRRFIHRRNGYSRFLADVQPCARDHGKPESIVGAPACLLLDGFALPKPLWLNKDDYARLRALAAASLFLLAYDRSPTGCWGRTYMFRKRAGNAKEPLSGGSLAGTPFALTALGSAIADLAEVEDWYSKPLRSTLARLTTKDGQYIATLDAVSTASSSGPSFEQPRHVAGGLLTKLLLAAIGTIDVATAGMLAQIPAQMLTMAWDKGTVLRAVLHARFDEAMPPKLKSKLGSKAKELLTLLISAGTGSGTKIVDLWADGYGYGDARMTQWVTAWSLAPLLRRLPTIPLAATQKLRALLREFLLAQSASSHPEALFARSIDRSGNVHGSCVFGTALAVLCWRMLEETATGGTESRHCAIEASSVLRRILTRADTVIELPSRCEENAIELEGYVGWTGLLLCAGCCGVRISGSNAMSIINLADSLSRDPDGPPAEYLARLQPVFGELAPAVAGSMRGIVEADRAYR